MKIGGEIIEEGKFANEVLIPSINAAAGDKLLKIEFTKTRILANGKKVIPGQVENIKKTEALAFISNGVAKEYTDGSTIHGDS